MMAYQNIAVLNGYGIKKINWNIYNRWGILVFSTNDIAEGWDGKFKDEFNDQSKINLTPIFNQYLNYKDIPILELKKGSKKLEFRERF